MFSHDVGVGGCRRIGDMISMGANHIQETRVRALKLRLEKALLDADECDLLPVAGDALETGDKHR